MRSKKLTLISVVLSLIFLISLLMTVNTYVLAQDGTKTTVTAKGKGIWILPGLRKLDPEIFGTPDKPLRLEAVPLENRVVSEDGESFTTTKNPGPFSNNVKEITGKLNIEVWDRTILDTPKSQDIAALTAEFTDPSGKNTYQVKLQKLIPVGPDHQFFGGAGTNIFMHGTTGIGDPQMPNSWSYLTLWGMGNFYRNGKLLDTNRIVHVMVTQRLRDENYKLGFGIAQQDELEIHLIMPNEKVSEGHPVVSPLPTQFKLPNGQSQPFIHVNFYENIEVKGNKFLE
ncbi:MULTISPECIES: hypothetical protein [Halanaerobium]|jgi:hypothetical protein|uniref:Uncharacterized protein n=1 Tax=Halanaerobium congolense TaxID=54121 RepID=A0A1M7K429_9FIRM|nr:MULTISPECIES: hypothetical protein [Halanaerobium]PUU88094.1 MAG: Uncharacterized protein CI949_3249 [Halanaerobium sp.]PXV61919.1 hypothetical protein C8C78_1421 [Halanaerobium congolense]SHM60082.1 hypothetical protein SAMN04515650_10522 [Halanaerobium congolense]